MKKLTIGRNNACNIIIPDTSDLVSRKQAVLAFDFWGRMTLYDTSNNGTYVNGKKLDNGKGVRVTRRDKVSFARIADLDWNEVNDPYSKNRIVAAICAALTIVMAILLLIWLTQSGEEGNAVTEKTEKTEMTEERGETVTTVQTTQIDNGQPKEQPAKKPKKKTKKQNKEDVTPDNKKDNEVNDKSPIVY